MNRPFLACVLFAVASAGLSGQQASPSDSYQGTSNPPTDENIETSAPMQAKPPAGKPLVAQPAPQDPVAMQGQPGSVDARANDQDPSSSAGTDAGIVQVAPQSNSSYPSSPGLSRRKSDPDGDIVHPRALGPGEIGEGTTIRVHLMDRLSTADAEKGETFRSSVATDVVEGGRVIIPAGAEIDGRVVEVSSGHLGGHGSMRLRPESVTLPDGTRFRLDAEVSGTPGSRTRVNGEGSINAGTRYKRDGIEYGGAVGAGAVTGAVLGGPVGALAGSLIGAGAVTFHLLVDHPQANLEPGTTLLFTLTEPLNLVATTTPGS